MSRITPEALFHSYGGALRAKVQLREFQSWGPSVTDDFRKAIANHDELEARYLVQMAADRRAQTVEFEAKLKAAERG